MPSSINRKTYYLCLLVLLILAGGLRLWGLGKWSYASDELGTFYEIELLLNPKPNSTGDDNVSKMIPISIGLHYLGMDLFGSSEFGSRLNPAFFGWLQILIVGLLLPKILNREITLATVLCLTLSSEHIFYCQYHRFYTITAFFVTLALLLGMIAINKRSIFLLILALLTCVIVMFSHTLSATVIGSLFLMALIGNWYSKGPQRWKETIVTGIGVFIAALIFLLYLYPLGKTKAIDYHWKGLLPFDALASSISQISWPIALAATFGFYLLWKEYRAISLQIAVICVTWLGMVFVFPLVFTFHSAYVFPLNIGYFILAGVIGTYLEMSLFIVQPLRSRIPLLIVAISIIPLMNLPSLVSYYQNGNRHDFRTAAKWLADNTNENDFLAVIEGDKLQYYQPTLTNRWKRIPRRDYQTWFEENRTRTGRNYFVFPGGRYGIPSEWKTWVEQNGSIQTTIVNRRFDDHDYPVIIVLHREGTGSK